MRRADPVAAAASRRGAVLGLTMAELMLLVCFCLAMLAAAGIAREREGRDKAEAEAARLAAVPRAAAGNEVLRGLVEAEAARSGSPPDDLWRRLTAADPPPVRTTAPPASASAPAADDAAERAARPEAGDGRTEGILAQAGAVVARLGRGILGRHDWPPIVTLTEAGGFRFASGSSALPPAFEDALGRTVVPRLVDTGKEYGVDVIEVVGHTDGQPLGGGGTNLDASLVAALRGHADPAGLRAADNAGLGLARAATVAAALRRDPRLDRFRIVPLSAGQAVGPDLRPVRSGADASLRRIEIRMRQGPGPRGG